MQVLFATSEVAPLIKTGGLADVSAALPAALRDLGVDVRIVVPGYPAVLRALTNPQIAAEFPALPGFPSCRLLMARLPNGVPLWFVDCAALYQRSGGIYQNEKGQDWPDNAERFGLLSRVAALLSCDETPLDWKPQILHCNDWQTGLAPAYLHFSSNTAASVMTIHNIAFQGIFPATHVSKLGLPAQSFQPEGVEFFGGLSFMKAGLFYANHITTVSPTYAKEIQTPDLGFGLDGLLSHKRHVLTGIVNGIDTDEWNPASDPNLVEMYDAKNLKGKSANKRALQTAMGLQLNDNIPLFGIVSRFTGQKGIDLVLQIAAQLITFPAQLVLLGSGDAEMERTALSLAKQYPGQIAAVIGFKQNLAHLIEAGADIFLMPSRFEPCGLSQLYSQRYGTPPVVYATGGLKDTVINCTPTTLERGTASGFVFKKMDAAGLMAVCQYAVATYYDKNTWRQLQHNCMAKDFSWKSSAVAYRDIYLQLTQQ